jgi:hypothetical protein
MENRLDYSFEHNGADYSIEFRCPCATYQEYKEDLLFPPYEDPFSFEAIS